MSELTEAALVAERATGVGGSDIVHVMSEPPWGCARRLFYDKRGVPRDYPDGETSLRFMRRGKRLEAIAAEEYEQQTGRTVRRTATIRDAAKPWRLVHIDRMQVRLDGVEAPAGAAATKSAPLELKVPGEAAFKRIVADGMPNAYVLQLQWALGLADKPWGSYGVLWSDGWTLLAFDVARNQELVRLVGDAVDTFWSRVKAGAEPARLPAGDARCKRCPWRRTCWGDELVAMLGVPDNERTDKLEAAPELEPILVDLLEAERLVEEYEELRDRVKSYLKLRLEERGAEAVEVAGHRVYYRQQKPGVGLDLDALRQTAKPGFLTWLFKNYGKARKAARPLRIY